MYYLMYIDIFEQDLFNKYTKLWYENNLDDTTKSDDELNNEALRLLKYDTLGFNLINGSKEEKEVDPIKELEDFGENFKKAATPKWLKRPVYTIYLKLFRKYIKEIS